MQIHQNHVDEYLEDLQQQGHSDLSLEQKRATLGKFVDWSQTPPREPTPPLPAQPRDVTAETLYTVVPVGQPQEIQKAKPKKKKERHSCF